MPEYQVTIAAVYSYRITVNADDEHHAERLAWRVFETSNDLIADDVDYIRVVHTALAAGVHERP